jgi:VanZ family protein
VPDRYKYTLFFISWMVLITVLSLIAFKDSSDSGFHLPHADKAAHFVFHLLAAILGCFFLGERSRGKLSLSLTIILVVIFLFSYGIIIEVIQYVFTTWRSGEITDVLANMLGAISGAVAVKFLFSGNWQLKWKN